MALNYGYNNANFYMQDLQNMRDRIDRQMAQMQIAQAQQPVPITQNFQLATNNITKGDFEGYYAKNVDEVKNKFVIADTLFVNDEMNTMWKKDISGNIKSYAMQEIIELDEKDKEILNLKKQIEEMKEMMKNDDKSFNTNVDGTTAEQKSPNVSSNKSSKK